MQAVVASLVTWPDGTSICFASMATSGPPPLPTSPESALDRRSVILLGVILVLGIIPLLLRLVGLIRPFSVPTEGMAPAVSAGDDVMMEGFSFLVRQPRRGDVVVLRTDGLGGRPPEALYVKRIAGEPGDRVRLADGKLYINERSVILSNESGEIMYPLPAGAEKSARYTDLTVPAGQCYVLGDNSRDSIDSRFWGCVPAECILGRIAFCFAPVDRVGRVR